MPRTALLAAWMLLSLMLGTAQAATLNTVAQTFGTTFGPCKPVQVTSALPFTVGLAVNSVWPWHQGLTITPMGGVGPTTLTVCVDKAKARANEVDHTLVAVTDARGTATFDVRVSCSGSSGCGIPGGGPHPTAFATGLPTPRPTATQLPVQDKTSSPLVVPTAVRTVPQPVATVVPPASSQFQAPQIAWRDVSISKQVPTQFLKWCPVNGVFISADQVCADAMENTRNVATMAAIRMWDHYSGRKQRDIDGALGLSQGFTHLIAQLWTTYRGNFGNYKNTWRTDKDGRQYHVAEGIAEEIRKLALEDVAFAKFVAAWPESTLPNPVDALMGPRVESPLLDFLDLRLTPDGKSVVAGGNFTRWAVDESTYDTAALKRGIIDYEAVLDALTAEQRTCVLETHHAHMAVSDFTCGVGPQPPSGIVGATHKKCSALARNVRELRLLTMLPFNGTFDDRWTQPERCAIARAQDAAHGKWADALLKLDGKTPGLWPAIELANQDHAALHLVANLKNPAFGISQPGCTPPIREATCPILYEPALMQRLMVGAP